MDWKEVQEKAHASFDDAYFEELDNMQLPSIDPERVTVHQDGDDWLVVVRDGGRRNRTADGRGDRVYIFTSDIEKSQLPVEVGYFGGTVLFYCFADDPRTAAKQQAAHLIAR